MSELLVDRFWGYVSRGAGCWEWSGARMSANYGVLRQPKSDGGKLLYAHRISYAIYHDVPYDESDHIHHKCHNPPCVNPDHLEGLSHQEHRAQHPTWVKKRGLREYCLRGHSMLNAYVRPDGNGRMCKTCRDQRWDAFYEKNKNRLNRKKRKVRANLPSGGQADANDFTVPDIPQFAGDRDGSINAGDSHSNPAPTEEHG